jgi:undecaprenyl-diphosphatase
MSLPITLGATVFEMKDVVKQGVLSGAGASPAVLLLGIVVSAVAGFWAIDFLLKYLKTRSVAIFAIWRIVVAFLVLVILPHIVPANVSAPKEPMAKTPVSQTHSIHH